MTLPSQESAAQYVQGLLVRLGERQEKYKPKVEAYEETQKQLGKLQQALLAIRDPETGRGIASDAEFAKRNAITNRASALVRAGYAAVNVQEKVVEWIREYAEKAAAAGNYKLAANLLAMIKPYYVDAKIAHEKVKGTAKLMPEEVAKELGKYHVGVGFD